MRFPVILPCVDNYQSMIHFKVRVVVFNATLNNRFFSYIVAVIFIGRGNQSIRRKPPTCSKSLKNIKKWCCIEYNSPWAGFQIELTTLVVIVTDCIGSCKSNYHTITTTTTPYLFDIFKVFLFAGIKGKTLMTIASLDQDTCKDMPEFK